MVRHWLDLASRGRIVERAGIVVGVIGVSAVLVGIFVWFFVGVSIHDVHIYELAGDRLNAGGRVYDLRPDDPFPAGEDRLHPLFGPPAIAIPWRFLVLLPGSTGVAIWLLVMTWLVLGSMFYVVLGSRGWVGAALLAFLAWPVVLVVGVGNVDSAITALLIVAWHLRGRARTMGSIIGLIAAVKLTPIVLIIWVTATRRWRALVWAGATAAVVVIFTIVVTEPGIWLRYVGVAADVALAGRTSALGLAVIGAAVVAVLARRSEGIAFALAVAVMPVGSPQASIHSWAVLLAGFAPLVEWLAERRLRRAASVSLAGAPPTPSLVTPPAERRSP